MRLAVRAWKRATQPIQLCSWRGSTDRKRWQGLQAGIPVGVVGAVVLRAGLRGNGKDEALMRLKIFEKGSSDWRGFIFGARALDTPARGGLGLRVTDAAFVLEKFGVVLPRLGKKKCSRDRIMFWRWDLDSQVSAGRGCPL